MRVSCYDFDNFLIQYSLEANSHFIIFLLQTILRKNFRFRGVLDTPIEREKAIYF